MKFLRALTIEKAILLAIGDDQHNTFFDFEKWLSGNYINQYVYLENNQKFSCKNTNVFRIANFIETLKEAMIEDIRYPNDCDITCKPPPISQNEIQIHKLETSQTIDHDVIVNFDSSKFTINSIVNWFIANGESEMALRIYPKNSVVTSPPNSNTDTEILALRLNNIPATLSNVGLFKDTLSDKWRSLLLKELSSDVSNRTEGLHTSENLELLNQVIAEFWHAKDPDLAAKQATNDVIKAWVKGVSPETSPTLAKNIAMIIRPDKYK
ncbi:hypothetical protein Q4575_10665 [Psychrosphaera sp. 1_MG-2023]|uniref:hypothetical protein n=1 Tax=Psychrosphaera sp. 1_MG-2023 TaxID=3062643 RepID=UPI0026E2296E|nr:hypothetical protein [Psychrosphaera sp. 1_MG-2023]MDO6719867.1 hypothetical protein [Psychrosphaera sp. 1_MG-2023]